MTRAASLVHSSGHRQFMMAVVNQTGFILPLRQVGAILFANRFQHFSRAAKIVFLFQKLAVINRLSRVDRIKSS